MRAATLLALRPIYHLIISNEVILIVLIIKNIMLLPASHVTYTVYYFTDLIHNSVCLSVYVTFFIKHHVSLPLIITAPRMRLVQST